MQAGQKADRKVHVTGRSSHPMASQLVVNHGRSPSKCIEAFLSAFAPLVLRLAGFSLAWFSSFAGFVADFLFVFFSTLLAFVFVWVA